MDGLWSAGRLALTPSLPDPTQTSLPNSPQPGAAGGLGAYGPHPQRSVSSLAYGSNDDGAGPGSRSGSDAPIVKTVDFGAPPPRASTTAPSPTTTPSKQAPPARQMSSVAVEEPSHGGQQLQQLHGEEVLDVVVPPTMFAPPSTGGEGCFGGGCGVGGTFISIHLPSPYISNTQYII